MHNHKDKSSEPSIQVTSHKHPTAVSPKGSYILLRPLCTVVYILTHTLAHTNLNKQIKQTKLYKFYCK